MNPARIFGAAILLGPFVVAAAATAIRASVDVAQQLWRRRP